MSLSDEERKRRGARALAILSDPLFTEAFDVLHHAQTQVFLDATCSDEQVLEARRMVLALEAVKAQFVSLVTDGKIAARRP